MRSAAATAATLLLRGGQRRPERAGATGGQAGGGGVGSTASHLCSFGRDASRARRVGFPARSEACPGPGTLPGPGLPAGHRADGRWHLAGSCCQAAACERWLWPAPFPSPFPGGGTQAFPRLQRSLCGASPAPSPSRPRCFAASRTQTSHARHSHTQVLPRWLSLFLIFWLAGFLSVPRTATPHPPPPAAASSRWPGEPARRPGEGGGVGKEGRMAALRLTSQAASRGARRLRFPQPASLAVAAAVKVWAAAVARSCSSCRRCSRSLLLPTPTPPLPQLHARGPPGGRASLSSLTQAPPPPPH